MQINYINKSNAQFPPEAREWKSKYKGCLWLKFKCGCLANSNITGEHITTSGTKIERILSNQIHNIHIWSINHFTRHGDGFDFDLTIGNVDFLKRKRIFKKKKIDVHSAFRGKNTFKLIKNRDRIQFRSPSSIAPALIIIIFFCTFTVRGKYPI